MKKLKVIHLVFTDVTGGAARATLRLHDSLLKEDIDSKVLVVSKNSDDINVIQANIFKISFFNRMAHFIDRLRLIFYRNVANKFSSAWFSNYLPKIVNRMYPDIVHIHWINNGQLAIKDLDKIRAPLVWSMLDMWPFTGGCHYSDSCIRYKKSCGKCPILNSDKAIDLSSSIHSKKNNVFSNIKIKFVAISSWLKSSAQNSSLLLDQDIDLVLPGLNTEIYKPINKSFSRDMFNLPSKKKLILFGAMSATSDPRKGYQLLLKAIDIISKSDQSQEFELVIFGATNDNKDSFNRLKTHYLGRLTPGYGLHDDGSLAALYSAADITVVPSLEEAFGQTASESLACGTPVVGFNGTGLNDIVDHMQNGYLANLNDPSDLAKGIIFVANSTNDLSLNARKKALNDFTDVKMAKNYINIYKNLDKTYEK